MESRHGDAVDVVDGLNELKRKWTPTVTSKSLREDSKPKEDGTDDLAKGNLLIELYSLQIQLYTAKKNAKKLMVSSFLSSDKSIVC